MVAWGEPFGRSHPEVKFLKASYSLPFPGRRPYPRQSVASPIRPIKTTEVSGTSAVPYWGQVATPPQIEGDLLSFDIRTCVTATAIASSLPS